MASSLSQLIQLEEQELTITDEIKKDIKNLNTIFYDFISLSRRKDNKEELSNVNLKLDGITNFNTKLPDSFSEISKTLTLGFDDIIKNLNANVTEEPFDYRAEQRENEMLREEILTNKLLYQIFGELKGIKPQKEEKGSGGLLGGLLGLGGGDGGGILGTVLGALGIYKGGRILGKVLGGGKKPPFTTVGNAKDGVKAATRGADKVKDLSKGAKWVKRGLKLGKLAMGVTPIGLGLMVLDEVTGFSDSIFDKVADFVSGNEKQKKELESGISSLQTQSPLEFIDKSKEETGTIFNDFSNYMDSQMADMSLVEMMKKIYSNKKFAKNFFEGFDSQVLNNFFDLNGFNERLETLAETVNIEPEGLKSLLEVFEVRQGYESEFVEDLKKTLEYTNGNMNEALKILSEGNEQVRSRLNLIEEQEPLVKVSETDLKKLPEVKYNEIKSEIENLTNDYFKEELAKNQFDRKGAMDRAKERAESDTYKKHRDNIERAKIHFQEELEKTPMDRKGALIRAKKNFREDTSISVEERANVTPVEERANVTPVEERANVTPVEERVNVTPVEERVSYNFSEMKFAEGNREKYEEFRDFRKQRQKEILEERAKGYEGGEIPRYKMEIERRKAKLKANIEAVKLYREEIEKTQNLNYQTTANVTPVEEKLTLNRNWENKGDRQNIDIEKEIIRIANENDLDPNLLKAVIMAESSFNPNAVSSEGASGYMQIMEGAAQDVGMNYDEIKNNPIANIEGGAAYLKQQIKRFGSTDLALSAYNAGPGKTARYGGVAPYKETQNYVKKVNEYKSMYDRGENPMTVREPHRTSQLREQGQNNRNENVTTINQPINNTTVVNGGNNEGQDRLTMINPHSPFDLTYSRVIFNPHNAV